MYMSSTSGSDGSYTLTISFKVGSNLNTALSLVQNYVNTALAQLPSEPARKESPLGKSARTSSSSLISIPRTTGTTRPSSLIMRSSTCNTRSPVFLAWARSQYGAPVNTACECGSTRTSYSITG